MGTKFWPAISRTGGGLGSLDSIDGNLLNAKDGAVVIMSTAFLIYSLTTSASTESDPTVITPDANPGSLRWELV